MLQHQHTIIGINQPLTGINQLQLTIIGINQLLTGTNQLHNGTMLHNTTMLHQLLQKPLLNTQQELTQQNAQTSHTAQHQSFQDTTHITLLHSQDSQKDFTQLEFQLTPAQTTQNVKYLLIRILKSYSQHFWYWKEKSLDSTFFYQYYISNRQRPSILSILRCMKDTNKKEMSHILIKKYFLLFIPSYYHICLHMLTDR